MKAHRRLDRRTGETKLDAPKRVREALALPKGVGFCVPLPARLLESPPWLAMSDQCRKLVDGLMAEHAGHGGLENGNLIQPYDQLERRGMRRGAILGAIVEAEALGIIAATRGVRSFGSRRVPSQYRLTWLGTPDGLQPTNEWLAIKSEEEALTRITNAQGRLAKERAERAARRAARLSPADEDGQSFGTA